jgi:hypothetical protein
MLEIIHLRTAAETGRKMVFLFFLRNI